MKLIYVAGKGGVGKSVCSAASGIWTSHQGKDTLVFSMDPAHSLSDIFDIDLGSQPRKIREHLYAYEPDLAEEARGFFRRYKNIFTALFGLFEVEVKPEDFGNMPGVSELIFMDKLNDIYVEKQYDYVVIDSAPTAMVLPLLQLPSITTGFVTKVLGMRNRWMGVLDLLQPGFGDSILSEVQDHAPESRDHAKCPARPGSGQHHRGHHSRESGRGREPAPNWNGRVARSCRLFNCHQSCYPRL